MKIRKNNKGFIATAVLYSLAVIIALILFLILRNASTMRKTNLDDGESLKDDLLSYFVNFDANGGSGLVIEKQKIPYGKSRNLTTCTYAQVGYTCKGWSLIPGGEQIEEPAKNLAQPGGEITVYAFYDANTYDIVLDANGGTVDPALIKVTYNQTYSDLPNPTRTGYNFVGWFTSTSGGTQRKKTDTVTTASNQTLYARWDAIKSTVTLNANGGSVSSTSVDVYYDGTYASLPDATRTGYDFVGWFTSSSGGIQVKTSDTVKTTANQTLYAHWTAKKSTVTLNANGGSVSPTSIQVSYDGTYASLPNATRTGYDFAGWFTAASGGTQVKTTDTVQTTANQTLYAQWTAKKTTVTLNANGGSVSPTSIQVTYDSTYASLPNASRSGYQFTGWFTAASGGTQVKTTDTVKATSNQTLYAHWVQLTHTVTYNYSTNGGTSATTTSATVTEGAAISLSPIATKSGWTFVGWNTSSTATTGLSSLTMGTSNVTLFAIFKKTVTVTFYDYSGGTKKTRSASNTMYNTATTTSIKTLSLNTASNSCGNFSSLGWSTSSSATASVTHSANTSYNFSGDTSLYARYSQTITFYIDRNAGSTSLKSKEQTRQLSGSGSTSNNGPWTYSFSDNCSRSGYTFVGWQGQYYKGSSVSYSCSVMYSAYWA